MSKIIAVSWSDFEKFGCVHCGCEYCHSTFIRGGGSTPVKCGECEDGFIILADGLDKSRIGIGMEDDTLYYPELQKHPREGIPKHEYIRPDIRPEEGEYWHPRGVGRNTTGETDLSGFVKCKAAGERIVQMVERVIGKTPKTWLDYRPHEPKWIQVKLESEDGFMLDKLHRLCKNDGIITEERLRQSLK